MANEERFDKIRYYLRHSSYPQGADRSEKSRLRSAATHYKLIGGEDGVPEKLMLKDKEVISDPQAQYEIAKQTHLQSHGGINKTTAMIATQYHWVRIKETVSHVIKNCPECKDSNKAATIRVDSNKPPRNRSTDDNAPPSAVQQDPLDQQPLNDLPNHQDLQPNHLNPHDFTALDHHVALTGDPSLHDHDPDLSAYDEMALDPQIIEQLQAQIASEDYQQHHQFVHSGLPDYADTSHLQHHQDPHGFGAQPPEQYIHNPGQAMMAHDHMMNDGGPTGLDNMQPMQHVLHMDYIDSDGTNYKQ